MNRRHKAFTLIELLVVIAIIALLMSIIIPALKKVKKQVAAIICLSNMKSMIAAWHTYTMDNDEKLVNGNVPPYTHQVSHHWVEAPQEISGTNYIYTGGRAVSGTAIPVEEEYNGIRRGLLFSYIGTVDPYHCLGDKSQMLMADAGYYSANYGSWWNSYSITAMMNGEVSKESILLNNPSATSGWDTNAAVKFTEIVNPGSKIVFLENVDWRGWLMGSWLMDYHHNGLWFDPFAIWHGEEQNPFSSLGFADGHADDHKWIDKTTIENASCRSFTANPPPTEREDIEYMSRAYVPGRFR